MLILDGCTDVSVLGTILFFKKLVQIISIIVPVLLVLLITIDFVKAVMANDENGMKKAQSLAIKRIIAGLLVFFIPLVVDTVFTTLSDKGASGLSCYNNASDEVLNPLIEAEKAKLELKEEERQKLIEEAKKSNQAAKDYIKTLQANRKNSSSSSSSSSSSNVAVSNKYIQAKKIAEAASPGKCSSGNAGNCTLGDQSGKEVRLSKWRKGWDYVWRPADPVVANKAAKCMEDAAKNNNIGYGRSGKYPYRWSSLWTYCKNRKDWDVSTVKKKINVSCCPLVAVCLKYAGYNPTNDLGCQSNSNMKRDLKKSGAFIQIYPGKSLNLNNIRRGDVLFLQHRNRAGVHMAMAV